MDQRWISQAHKCQCSIDHPISCMASQNPNKPPKQLANQNPDMPAEQLANQNPSKPPQQLAS